MEHGQNNYVKKQNVSVSFCQNSVRNPNNYVRNSLKWPLRKLNTFPESSFINLT